MHEPTTRWDKLPASGRRVAGWVGSAVLLLLLVLPSPSHGQDAMETLFWESVECESAPQVQAYLQTYPGGAYVARAGACLERQLGLDREDRLLVQQGLAALNYSEGIVDGLFRPATRRAIREWQQAKEFAATGYLTREQAARLIARGREEARRADDTAYARAQRVDTRAAYEDYLAAYPTGRHVAEAREKITPVPIVRSAQDYIGQVETLLGVLKLRLGDGWEETHNPEIDRLDDGGSNSFRFSLEEGRTYRVASVCDADCSDLDLTLYDENDNEISRDISTDDVPIVEASPSRTGRFRLQVDMHSCSSNPCYYGISIFGQSEAPPSREVRNSIGMEFVLIEPGTFQMGSPAGEAGRFNDEALHRVTLSQPFYLGKYEVTQEQWQAVMGRNPSDFSSCGSACPVEKVSWEDVQGFIAALNQREGVRSYRLPTEAEWEYAARGGTQTAYHFGDTANRLGQYGWDDENAGERTHPVGQKRPNGWGLYDMHGNVWEWVADWHGDYPSGRVSDPGGPSTGARRVLRGGGWNRDARNCRAALRNYATPDARGSSIGIRLARTP